MGKTGYNQQGLLKVNNIRRHKITSLCQGFRSIERGRGRRDVLKIDLKTIQVGMISHPGFHL